MNLNRSYAAVMLLWLLAFLATVWAQNSEPQLAVKDPLKTVAVYSGKWHSEDETFDTKLSKPSKESVDFINDCSTQREFFVCHQEASKASGTSSTVMVFLWNSKARLFETYVMDSGGGDPYHGHLTVDGDTYIWESAAEKESGTRWHTLNLFSGRDHIVYRVQFSTDHGKTWTTTREGKETRVSQ